MTRKHHSTIAGLAGRATKGNAKVDIERVYTPVSITAQLVTVSVSIDRLRRVYENAAKSLTSRQGIYTLACRSSLKEGKLFPNSMGRLNRGAS